MTTLQNSNPGYRHLLLAVGALICSGMVLFVSWSLLTPDPFAIVRDSPLAWLEQVSDLIVHTAVFAVLSASCLGFCFLFRRELPLSWLLAMLSYCVSMEMLQAYVPGRDCSPLDGMANVAGFVFGLLTVRSLNGWRHPGTSNSLSGDPCDEDCRYGSPQVLRS